MNGLQLLTSGVNAHSSSGIGERLQEPLREVCKKIRYDHSTEMAQYFLTVAVGSINDSIRENSLGPSRLVFAINPRFSINSTELPKQNGRMEVLKTA